MGESHVKHDGENFSIYYFAISSFEDDLPSFGRFLEEMQEKEEVVAIVPNVGLVDVSWLLGTSFQGVKGFAVIARKLKK